jgi:hypothetical protein
MIDLFLMNSLIDFFFFATFSKEEEPNDRRDQYHSEAYAS